MCILLVHINPSPRPGQYRLVLVNNRDEVYTRPTQPAHLWPSGIYAGMDLEPGREGGTWLGINEEGKIGCLLNIFQPANNFRKNGESRGSLVAEYLKSPKCGDEYLNEVSKSSSKYNPFSLVTLDPKNNSYTLNYYTSRPENKQPLDPGTYGFGNSAFDKPFRKVEKGQKKLEEIVGLLGRTEQEQELIEALQVMMQDAEPNLPDPQLSEQGHGYPEEYIRALSSIWVTCCKVGYGSRTTTVILVSEDGRVVMRERTMRHPVNIDSLQWDENTFTFSISRS